MSRREGHDSSAFYARFDPPRLDADEELGPRPEAEGPILGDARNMRDVPDRSVALVVTSPPYFVGKEYENEVMRTAGSDPLGAGIPETYRQYLHLLHDVFSECRRVMEPGGRIAVNVANLGRKPYRSLSRMSLASSRASDSCFEARSYGGRRPAVAAPAPGAHSVALPTPF